MQYRYELKTDLQHVLYQTILEAENIHEAFGKAINNMNENWIGNPTKDMNMLIVLQSQDKLESIFAFIKPYKYYGKKY
jgi:hypothetical protein